MAEGLAPLLAYCNKVIKSANLFGQTETQTVDIPDFSYCFGCDNSKSEHTLLHKLYINL